jgi:hypothetical protein
MRTKTTSKQEGKKRDGRVAILARVRPETAEKIKAESAAKEWSLAKVGGKALDSFYA